jgi:DnaJ family protein C protein 17
LLKQRAYKEKYARFDAKRKAMQDDLEEREREFKKAKMESVKEQREREEKEAYVRDQGRRMREDREKAALAKDQTTQRIPESKPLATGPEEIGELLSLKSVSVRVRTDRPCLDYADLTVRVKFTTTLRPDLATPTALVALLRSFGTLDGDTVHLSIKPPKKHPTKPPKFATALVTFQKVQGAFGAVGASGQKARGLENVDIAWVKGVEPEIVQRLRSQGKLAQSLNGHSAPQGDRATVSGSIPEVSRKYFDYGNLLTITHRTVTLTRLLHKKRHWTRLHLKSSKWKRYCNYVKLKGQDWNVSKEGARATNQSALRSCSQEGEGRILLVVFERKNELF